MTADRGTGTVRAVSTVPTRRGVGWWVRTVAMVLIPLGIGLLAARTNPTQVAVVVGLMAFVGAIYVFHPDTLGWKLSLTGYMSKGPDTGPSHAWQVWARLSGLVLLVVCGAGAILYSPPPPNRNSCTIAPDGAFVCPWNQPQDVAPSP